MNIDIAALRMIEADKGISIETVITAIETALLTAYRHTDGFAPHARVDVNRKTGDYHCHRSPARQPIAESYASAQGLAPLKTGSQGGMRSSGAFKNCTEARAAGAAPVRIGEPGYGPHLDRDGDGIGCEPYRGRR